MTLGRYDAAISPSFIEGLTLEGPIGHTGMSSPLLPWQLLAPYPFYDLTMLFH